MTTRVHTSARAVAVALLATLAAFLLASPAPAASLSRGASTATAAPAGARLLSCRHSPAIDERTAVVGAWMRPLPAGRRLALRVDLWQRNPGARWTQRTDVPGLGVWTTPSDAGLGSRAGDIFKYRQAVGRLVVLAAYRFHITFHWLNADGAVVREVSRTTAICRQPDLRPDLVLRDVRALPARDGSVRYLVRVGNEGRGAVVGATVAATFPGDATPGLHLRTVRRLEPSASAVVTFTGPGCAAGEQPAAFLADPSNAVEEVNEANNALTGSCPAP
ncbi:MAG TPA: CARDB domain-containing protein [Conexibacter sp.]|nr:CARDB domain-containing protein [Conexibacter sp.]